VRIQEEHGSQATSYMRRHVSEDIGQNQARSRSQEAGSVAPTGGQKSSGRRGPQKRPIYRLWEYATWRARMRAWCNQIKVALLKQESDPTEPQTYRVIQAPTCPIDSQSTWLTWWEGEAIPRPSHIAAAENVAPGSSELLDLSEMRTCISRHFLALDIVNTKFRVTGRPSDYRPPQARPLLTGLNGAWLSFLDTEIPPQTSRYNVVNQLGHTADELLAGYVPPTEMPAWGGGNPARWMLPPGAVYEHNWLEPVTILRFLTMLAASDCFQHPRFVELWAIDLASATLTIRTLIETSGKCPPGSSMVRMGFAGFMYMIATSAFIAPRDHLYGPDARRIAYVIYGDSTGKALDNLNLARDTYYNVFAGLGISETALRALNGTHWEKTLDGAFSAARARL
jgi:hypothetical protein